jgi:hypothetical protein
MAKVFQEEMVAGPDLTVTITGRPEVAMGGVMVNGASPNIWDEIVAKAEIVLTTG